MKRDFLFFLLFFFKISFLLAQIPSINSFSPAAGQTGSTVIIQGSNFSATPSSNAVQFNGVAATVTSSTTTTLFVTVPSGATFGTISVTVGGQTGTSLNSFASGSTNLYGMVYLGGANGAGDIFKTNTDGTNLTPVYSFGGTADGSAAQNAMIVAANGKLYGMTLDGGTIAGGVLFEFDPATSIYTKKIDFDGTNNGNLPQGSLVQASDGKLYGLTSEGGANNAGVLFQYDPNSSVLTKKIDLSYSTSGPGASPNGSLIEAWDGNLYGLTYAGGAFGYGTIIQYNVSTSTLTKMADFNTTTTGGNSYGSLMQASNGKLYGFLHIGVSGNGNGSLIEYDPSTATLVKKLDLTGATGGALGDLVQGSNGKLYANTWAGILEYDLTAVTLTRKVTYNNSTTYGSTPYYGALTQGSNGKLYGMNYGGGVNNYGVLFEYDPSTTTFTKKFDFDLTNGKNPYNVNLVEVPLYSNQPTITSFTPTSATHGTMVTITGSNFSTASAVSFGGTSATSFTIVSASTITAIVPEGTTGAVAVTNPNGTATSGGFIFLSAPTITSFSPSSGAVGTSVTITGTNFSTTSANNIIYFGASKATVTSATSTQLTVTVPSSASYQPITVLTNGVFAYSSKPFLVTFSGGAGITTSSYATKADFTTGFNPNIVVTGDLDGDGKAEFVASNSNSSSNSVSIFQNTSSGSSNINFASKTDISLGATPYGLAIADMDADGKLDLVVINGAGSAAKVSVFRNTSSGTGSFSFASQVDLIYSNIYPSSNLAIADYDNDGRNDIAMLYNQLYVLRNISTGPGIISFDNYRNFNLVSGSGSNVYAADFDNDGKQDLCITQSNQLSVSIFRNSSAAPGNINFAANIDFATTARPTAVTIADFDLDGKIDIIAGNQGTNAISVLRNASSGSLNFATKVDFPSSTSVASLSSADLDGDGKIDIAAANSGINTVSVFTNSSSGSISFNAFVDINVGTAPYSISVQDFDNDGRNDFVTANYSAPNSASVLRYVLPPHLTSFAPTSAAGGATVTITGSNFTGVTAVSFGGIAATSFSVISPTSISAVVAAGSSSGNLSVTGPGGTVSLAGFTFIPLPTVTSFAPTNATTGATVTITGTNFTGTTSVSFGGTAATSFTAVSSTSITAVVASGTTGSISVTTPGGIGSKVGFGYLPIAPTATAATSVSQTVFTANWNAVAGATGYYLDVATDNGFISYVTNFNNASVGNVTSISPGGLAASTTYYYRVRAVNATGASANSNTISLTTSSSGGGGNVQATNILFSSITTNSATVNFTAGNGTARIVVVSPNTALATGPNNNATYTANTVFGSGGTVGTGYTVSNGTSTSVVVTNLTPGSTYYVQVFEYTGSTGSENYNLATATGNPLSAVMICGSPTAIAATSLGQTSFSANWNSDNGATGYYLDVSTTNTFSTFVSGYSNLYAGNVTTYSVSSNLTAGTVYYYRVRATNTSGTSANSNSISLTTVPPDPVATAATSLAQTSFSANWSTSTTATVYYLDVSTSNTFSTFVTGYNNLNVGNSTTYSANTNVSGGTIYYYRVRASSTSGTTNSSNTITLTTVPPNPVATSPASITQTSFAANWNPSASATSYILDVSTSNTFSTFVTGYSSLNVGNVTGYAVSSGLSAGTTYYYRVSAKSSSGTSGTSNTMTLITAPSTPTAIAASVVGQTSFTANWNATSTATGYYLDVSTSNTFSTFVSGYDNFSVGNATSFLVNSNLNPGTTYFYQVRAANAFGTSVSSNAISVLTVPSDPVAAASTSVTQTSFTANWGSSASATNYYLDVSTINTFATFVSGYNNLNVNNVTSYSVSSNIVAGTNYYYRIRSSNTSGTSNGSNTITLTTVPTSPVATSASSLAQTSFSANWNSSATATGYYLDVSLSNTFVSFVSGYNNLNIGNVTTYSVNTNLAAGTTYYYQVRAASASGTSTNSNVISLLTVPPDPVTTAASSIAETSFNANWSSSATATSYFLDVSTSNTFSPLVTGYNNLSVGNVTSYTVSSAISGGTIYYYRVRAASSSGTSNSSTTTSLTTAPPSPVATSATLIAQTSFSANWTSSSTATGYYLDVSTSSTFSPFVSGYSNLSVGNVTTYSINTSIAPGTTYYYQVRAISTNGTSNNSNSISVVTVPPNVVATAATALTQTSFTANWNSSTTATGYYLDVSTSNTFGSFVAGYSNVNVGNVSTYSVNAGLTASTTYYYRVRAFSTTGTAGNSNTITVTTTPANPVATGATLLAQTSFSANWNSSPSATGYFLDVSTSNSFSTFVTGYSNLNVGNVATYSVTSNLAVGTTYYYQVRAFSASGTSNNSNSISVVTIPANPIANSATAVAETAFTANWNSSATATSYLLDVSTSNTFSSFVTGYNNLNVGNVNSYLVSSSITGGINYYYRVRATSGSGTSGNSNAIGLVTAPPTPVVSAATSLAQTSFSANWSASNTATSYFLDVSTTNTFISFVSGYYNLNVGNIATFSVNSNLAPGTTYYYQVRGSSAVGVSNNSNVITVVTVPPNPIDNGATLIGETSFTSNWNSSTTATAYFLDVSTSSTFGTFVTGYNNLNVGNVTSYSINSGIVGGTNYYYRVRATSPSGTSGNSNTISLISAPPSSVASAATLLAQTSFSANWSASSTATSYFLDVSTSSTFSTFVTGYGNLNVGNTTTYSVNSNLTPGTTYYYRLRASSSAGISNNSNVISLVTVPSNPVTTSASMVSETSFTANWNSIATATAYYLDVSTSPSFSTFVSGYSNLNVGNVTSYAVNNNISGGTSYYYQVRALSPSGTSNNSNITSLLTLPSSPVAQAATSITQNGFNASWSAVSGATGYFLDVAADNGFATLIYNSISVGNITSFAVSALSAGNTYYYRIRSTDGSGNSINSNVVTITTSSAGGGSGGGNVQASNVVFNSITNNSLTVSFTIGNGNSRITVANPVSSLSTGPTNAVTYVANNSYGSGDTFTSGFVIGNGTSSSIAVSNLTPGTTYYFQIFEYTGVAGSESYYTSIATGNPASVITVCDPPVVTPATVLNQTSFQANWNASTGASGYFIDVSTDVNFGSFITGFNNKSIGNTTSTNVSGLNNATTYYYRLRAVNASGTSINSNNIQALTIPATPVANTATQIDQTSFTSNWNSVLGATGYYLDVATDVLFTSLVSGYANLLVNGISIQVSGLNAGTNYYSRVRSANSSGSSQSSNSISVLTIPPDPIASLPNNYSDTGFTANWGASTGATTYFLDVSSDNFNTFISGYNNLSVGNVISINVAGLNTAANYQYQVRAMNNSGISGNSNSITALTLPTTPTSVDATSLTQTSFNANWNGVAGAVGYYVDVSIDVDFTSILTSYSNLQVSIGTTLSTTGLTAGTKYYYRVRSFDASGSSPSSNIISLVTIPATPIASIGSNFSTTSFTANWSIAPNATSYFMDVSTDNFSTFISGFQNQAVGNVTFYTITGLAAGTEYQYQVRASNASGTSGNSNIISTITLPNAPIANAATAVSQSVFSANWNPAASATNYYLDVATSSDFVSILSNYNNLSVGNVMTLTINGLSAATTYYYQVRAQNASGSSASSNVVTVKTSNPPVTVTEAIPTLSSGGTLEDYAMFSIPLVLQKNDSTIATIFSSLGTYSKDKWRLLRWNSGSNDWDEYLNGLTTIDRGKSYWFNAAASSPVVITGYDFSNASFALTLNQGWNQISSPYNFDVSWTDVLANNNSNANIGNIETSIYKYVPSPASFAQTDNLKAWSGNFVFNKGSNTTLAIPQSVKHATGGRIASNLPSRDLTASDWFVPLLLSVNESENSYSGFGMHTDANVSIDKYDGMTVPRFMNYLELNSYHTEFFEHDFSRDIVTTSKSFNWHFIAESNYENKNAVLSWDNQALGLNSAKLILYDPLTGSIVDMKQSNQYGFQMSEKHPLHFFYASDKDSFQPDVTSLANVYPNPVSTSVTFPFFTSANGEVVQIEVYDMMGKKVKTVVNGIYEPGLQQTQWDTNDDQGIRVGQGVYIYRFVGANNTVQSGKLVIR